MDYFISLYEWSGFKLERLLGNGLNITMSVLDVNVANYTVV